MFTRLSSKLTSKLSGKLTLKNTRKAGLLTLPLIAAAFITPIALADGPRDRGYEKNKDWRHRDNDWRGDYRDRDNNRGTQIVIRPEIVIGRPSRPDVAVIEKHYPRQRIEAAPYEVRFKAYQSEDRIIVTVDGANRSSGFQTTLSSHEDGVIEICNLAPADECAQAITPFCMTASIHAHYPMHSIKVCIAGRTYTVPVTQAESLS